MNTNQAPQTKLSLSKPNSIVTVQSYKDLFNPAHLNQAGRNALEVALETRKFEVENYWKRSTYFWTLIGAVLAGYFVLATPKLLDSTTRSYEAYLQELQFYKLVVSGIGVVFSFGAYLANRGSKYWQDNWESHVILLEGERIGPLFGTTRSKRNFGAFRLLSAYPYSVTKINHVLSLFITSVWLVLFSLNVEFAKDGGELRVNLFVLGWIVALLTLAFACKTRLNVPAGEGVCDCVSEQLCFDTSAKSADAVPKCGAVD